MCIFARDLAVDLHSLFEWAQSEIRLKCTIDIRRKCCAYQDFQFKAIGVQHDTMHLLVLFLQRTMLTEHDGRFLLMGSKIPHRVQMIHDVNYQTNFKKLESIWSSNREKVSIIFPRAFTKDNEYIYGIVKEQTMPHLVNVCLFPPFFYNCLFFAYPSHSGSLRSPWSCYIMLPELMAIYWK